MISSTRISGLFASSTMSSSSRPQGGVYRNRLLRFAGIGRCDGRVFAVQQVEQPSRACLECRAAEALAAPLRLLLDGGAQTLVADEPRSPRAQLVQSPESEAVQAVLDDFALASAIEDDRSAPVLHRLDRRHPEVLDEMWLSLVETTRMPEYGGLRVPGPQLRHRDIHPQIDAIRIAPDGVSYSLQVAVALDGAPD